MKNTSLLIVDDEKNIRRSVEMICTGEGYAVKTAADAAEADQILAAETMDLILLDVMMPGMDGLTFLKKIKSSSPEVAVIMISGNATVQNAVAATKEGAYDFIEKPISKEKLLLSIQNALQSRTLAMENLELRKQVAATYDMVGESRAMQEIREQIAKVAPTPGRVLISGESGTGKELIARALPENSPRKNRPFIQGNCAAIPEELI
ncbi:sigma-54-dependent Fis family transcriptional regulator, partial [candidate division KSB1 bacterium]|nr:sigma-54-dependent Fis family transcriptional regulator [candidate division KSB1 bacterium]